MNYLKQIWADFRQQPLIGIVTLSASALAIFLIMMVVIIDQVNVAAIAPESNRDRFLHARFVCIKTASTTNGDENTGSGPLSLALARKLYDNLDNTVATTFYNYNRNSCNVGLPGQKATMIDARGVDNNFWRVFDFTFINGRGFTADEMNAHARVAVITAEVAQKVFGNTDVVGREFRVNRFDRYTVVGVVENVSMLTSTAYAQMWLPIDADIKPNDDPWWGNMYATILVNSVDDIETVHAQVDNRLKQINSTEMAAANKVICDFGAPYTTEQVLHVKYSNVKPDFNEGRKEKWIIYILLMLVPAINLSSINQSRLRRRVSEFGVRRAFGCTRWTLAKSILIENLITTAIGAIIGLMLSLIFARVFATSLFNISGSAATSTNVSITMLLNPTIFIYAVVCCFILNLLCSSIPAWRAARIPPVEAINGDHAHK